MVCIPVGFVIVFSLTGWVHPADKMKAARSKAVMMSACRINMDIRWGIMRDRDYGIAIEPFKKVWSVYFLM
jgi:hypothetical protein